MRRRTLFLVSALLATALYAMELRASDGLPDLGRGASLYSANCGRCHNPRGPGEFSDRTWPLVITHMRVIAGLPGEQARAIEAFIRASNNPPARRLAAAALRPLLSGEELVNRSGCRGCHTIGGAGGMIGPALDDVFTRRSEDWIRAQIQNPREHNPKTVMPQLGLSEDEIGAIIEVLRGP